MTQEKVSPDDLHDGVSPRRRADVTSVELDGESVLYSGEVIHRLDAIATVLWNCLDGTVTIGELVDDLVAVYPDTAPDEVRSGVYDCIRTLGRDGLLANVRAEAGEATS